ncbi:amidohydrolase 3 [Russula earlei]|uniref:Amidohydrolase 3 n=1 Tax=Russula earlei TaxID=71964 RepID=A0ACC0TSN1_9AGAM|nr:amidohydrolase 3 [Russula earlei]
MKKHLYGVLLLLVCTFTHAQFGKIYTAKEIITEDSANDIYTNSPAVVVNSSGKVEAVGTLNSLQTKYRLYKVDNTFINSVIMPGFVEAHTHLQSYGMNANLPYIGYFDRPGLNGTIQHGITSMDSIIIYLKGQLQKSLPLYASGGDPIYFNCSRFTSQFLDNVSTTVPIVLQLGSGHIVICNTPMMNVLETLPGWKTLPPGTIVRNSDSIPTGELDESAGVEFVLYNFDSLYKKANHGIPFYNPVRLINGITNGAALMQAAGITTATELMFTAPTAQMLTDDYILYQGVARLGARLPVRVVLGYDGFAIHNFFPNSPDSAINYLKEKQKYDDSSLITGPVKFIFDGSIQGYTAQVDSPYVTQPQNPFWNISPASIASIMAPYLKNGFSVAIHANGDSAISKLITALDSLQPVKTTPGIWATIEHDQLTRPYQYAAVSKLPGVAVNLFMNHIYYYGQQHAKCTVGPAMAFVMDDAYLADSLHIPYSLHSDAPITPAQPLFAAWVATHRTPATIPGGYYNNTVFGDTISTPKALYSITMGGARLLNLQNMIGSIEPGKFADFAILSADPLSTPLNTIKITGTMKGGQYYQAPATTATRKKQ